MHKLIGIMVGVALVGGALFWLKSGAGSPGVDETEMAERPFDPGEFRESRREEARTSRLQSARATAVSVANHTRQETDLMAVVTEEREWPPEVLRQFVEKNRMSPESYIAAFSTSRDTNYLHQAAREHPDHPMVQLAVIQNDLYPEEKQAWIEALKLSTPDNALPHYLSAIHHQGAGDFEAALHEIQAGNEKGDFLQYHQETAQIAEEFYLENGYSPLEAKAKALFGLELPYLAPLRNLSKDMVEEVNALQQQGHLVEAEQLAQEGIAMAQQLSLNDGNTTLINQLVGLSMEQAFLGTLDENTHYFGLSVTAGDMSDDIRAQQDELKRLTQKFNALEQRGDEQLADTYLDRVKLFGEYEALKWLDGQL